MTIKLDVTLDTTTTPPYLDIDQQDNTNHVSRNPLRQIIKWKLTSNAYNGAFNSISDPNNPGFQWIGTAPNGAIFTSATLSDDAREITITDLNDSETSTGEWIYRLCATIGGQVYQSNSVSLTETTTNPSIKNK